MLKQYILQHSMHVYSKYSNRTVKSNLGHGFTHHNTATSTICTAHALGSDHYLQIE